MVELCFVFVVVNTKSEQELLFMRKIEENYRSRLREMSLSVIIRIAIDGLPCKDFDLLEAVNINS